MQVKGLIAMVLAATLSLSLAACSSSQTGVESSSYTETQQEAMQTESSEASDSSEVQEPEEADDDKNSAENKTLILYFSADNTKDVDAVSSATPMTDGMSSVKWIAEIIHEKVGGDIAEIIPSEDYPLGYNELADAAKVEADSDARPAIEALNIDPTSYDTVFIGYPIWWYKLPMVMETFFDTYDFIGVTIIPFNTHAGSRTGGTYDMIRDREPGANVMGGLAVRGEDVGKDSARNSVKEWLDGLNLE